MIASPRASLLLVTLFIVSLRTSSLLARDECTTAVVSPRVTGFGGPLLWKNRDTSHRDNAVVLLIGERFRYVALINAGDTTQVWAGVNEAGFGIMNAEALDTEGDSLDAEGYFMAEALGTCASVRDFEQLLIRTNRKGRGTKSNFGVIDALGNAAFFETGNHTYSRYDANLSESGWIVRTNFAQTGDGSGAGVFRFARARQIFRRLAANGPISPRAILKSAARDLITPTSLVFDGPPGHWLRTAYSINRYRTSACVIVQGVGPHDDPRLTTFWVVLGEPLFGAALPMWLCTGEVPLPVRGPAQPQINRLIQKLEQQAYSAPKRGDLLNLDWLRGEPGGRILENLARFEDRWFARVDSVLNQMRSQGVDTLRLRRLQDRAAEDLAGLLRELGGIR